MPFLAFWPLALLPSCLFVCLPVLSWAYATRPLYTLIPGINSQKPCNQLPQPVSCSITSCKCSDTGSTWTRAHRYHYPTVRSSNCPIARCPTLPIVRCFQIFNCCCPLGNDPIVHLFIYCMHLFFYPIIQL